VRGKMDEKDIQVMLDQLAEYQAMKDVMMLERQKLIDEIYTEEIKQRMAEVEIEFAGKTETVDENIERLTEQIKQAVIEHGKSVKSSVYGAVYVRGRVTWNAKSLDGYAIAHPQILSFRKEGKPSVSLRIVK